MLESLLALVSGLLATLLGLTPVTPPQTPPGLTQVSGTAVLELSDAAAAELERLGIQVSGFDQPFAADGLINPTLTEGTINLPITLVFTKAQSRQTAEDEEEWDIDSYNVQNGNVTADDGRLETHFEAFWCEPTPFAARNFPRSSVDCKFADGGRSRFENFSGSSFPTSRMKFMTLMLY